jgi:hypothetical protein
MNARFDQTDRRDFDGIQKIKQHKGRLQFSLRLARPNRSAEINGIAEVAEPTLGELRCTPR